MSYPSPVFSAIWNFSPTFVEPDQIPPSSIPMGPQFVFTQSVARRVGGSGITVDVVTVDCFANSSSKRPVVRKRPNERLYLAKNAGFAPHQSCGPNAIFNPSSHLLPA